MKLWYGFGSEHSMRLRMIGKFKEARDAAEAMRVIDAITALVNEEVDSGEIELDGRKDRYSAAMLDLLDNLHLLTVSPRELEQFAYDVGVEQENDEVIVTTDEADVSAYLKIMIHKGARLEVYSAHNYARSQDGREL